MPSQESEAGSSSEEESDALEIGKDSFAYLRHADDVYFFYSCLLPEKSLPLLLERTKSHKPVVVLVLSGGRFAGAVLREGKAVVHKTFARYTVRAKQGGMQAMKDGANASKAPKSAGATLRRYNQQALAEEVGELLSSWAAHLKEASEIFVRFSTYHRAMLFQAPSPLQREDPRIRTIPLVTRRPTLAEVQRLYQHLIALYHYGGWEEFQAAQKAEAERVRKATQRRGEQKSAKDDAYDYSILEDNEDGPATEKSPKKQKEKVEVEKKEEKPSIITKAQATQLYTLVKAGSPPELEAFLDSLGLDHLSQLHILSQPEMKDSSSFLHMAASLGHAPLVHWILHFGVSPCLRNSDGEVAYQVAQGRAVRSAMSRFRVEKEQLWDWNQAQIPLPLSDEAEEAKSAKLAEKRRREKERKRERAKEEKIKLREEQDKDRFLNLSDREKRAMAAEARLGIVSRCFACALEMPVEKVPFEYNGNRFCSPACVRAHRAANPL